MAAGGGSQAVPAPVATAVVYRKSHVNLNLLLFRFAPLALLSSPPLDALALLRDVCLVIVGEGPLRSQLEGRARELAISQRVRWLGQLSDDDLAGAFSGADVFVLSSVAPSEAFGLVQVEAMAAGLPVVSTRLGTSVEIVNVDGATGTVVDPGDPRALARAIRGLVEDEALRGRLSAGALKHAGEFAEDRLVKRYRDMYASAAEERGS